MITSHHIPPNKTKIAILFSQAKREYFLTDEHYQTEAEVKERAKLIANYLTKMGYQHKLIPGNDQVAKQLSKYQPHLVLNLVDSIYGQEYLSSAIPGVLETLRIPYTGSGILGQSLNSNKYLTKSLLRQYGITTPKYQFFSSPQEELDLEMDFPLIVKLNEIHGSVEISKDSVCFNEKELKKKIKDLYCSYRQPIIVEEFIAGDEVTVMVVEGSLIKTYSAKKIFPEQEKVFNQIVTYADNWEESGISYEKYLLPDDVKTDIRKAYEILKMEDYAKFDIRVDQAGRHYLIDANSNPSLGPAGNSAIGSILELYGVSFERLLERLINNTLHECIQKL